MAKVVGEQETIVVRHFRVVLAEGERSGIVFSTSDREYGYSAEEKAQEWVDRMTAHGSTVHLEEWTQTYTVSPSTWEQVR